MKTLSRRFIQAGVALLFLAAAPLPVQAWTPKKPAHKEYKDPLSVYQKTLSSGLSTFNKNLQTLIKGIKDGSVADPEEAYEDLWEALWEAVWDGDISLETAIEALDALHPEDSLIGDPEGDLRRLLDVAHNLVDCVANAAIEKLLALEKIKDHNMKVAAEIFDAYLRIIVQLALGAVAPPKQVSIGWYASGRLSTDADDHLRCGGLAPSGSTVDVTVDCGTGHVMTFSMVAVDSKCRWKINIPGGVPIGNCQVSAHDHADANNNSSRTVSMP